MNDEDQEGPPWRGVLVLVFLGAFFVYAFSGPWTELKAWLLLLFVMFGGVLAKIPAR